MLVRVQIREKTLYDKPWMQSPRSRVSPDTEVRNIMKTNGSRPKTPLKGSQFTRPYGYSPGTG